MADGDALAMPGQIFFATDVKPAAGLQAFRSDRAAARLVDFAFGIARVKRIEPRLAVGAVLRGAAVAAATADGQLIPAQRIIPALRGSLIGVMVNDCWLVVWPVVENPNAVSMKSPK